MSIVVTRAAEIISTDFGMPKKESCLNRWCMKKILWSVWKLICYKIELLHCILINCECIFCVIRFKCCECVLLWNYWHCSVWLLVMVVCTDKLQCIYTIHAYYWCLLVMICFSCMINRFNTSQFYVHLTLLSLPL